jgi:hypothetical protein
LFTSAGDEGKSRDIHCVKSGRYVFWLEDERSTGLVNKKGMNNLVRLEMKFSSNKAERGRKR